MGIPGGSPLVGCQCWRGGGSGQGQRETLPTQGSAAAKPFFLFSSGHKAGSVC